jgi:osmoprotectant transport system permease protein
VIELLLRTWEYFLANQPEFWAKTGVHLSLSATALLVGVLVGLTFGILTAQDRTVSALTTSLMGALRALPSLAVMAAMLPLIGVGFLPALAALTLLAIPPILINTQVGLMSIDAAVLEAAQGMGMSRLQILRQVQLPLALPVWVAGIRTASVEVLASATIGAIIGAGGLGEYVFAGLSLGPAYIHIMLVGGIMIALLTFTAENLLGGLEAWARRAFYHET